MADITTSLLDKFKAKRSQQPGEKKGSKVSPATINSELRVISAAVKKATLWKYLQEEPVFKWMKEPQKMPRFMTEEHFAAIYAACHHAKRPTRLPYSAGEWWQGLLTFIYFTGWRISEPTALLRRDVNFDGGYAVTRYADNKGYRDELVKLHPIVVEHLVKLNSFHTEMFPWTHSERQLWREFQDIQQAAGIRLHCPEKNNHQCGTDCWFYGFHDIRRTFATVTGQELSPAELQAVMRHKDYSTTQQYINERERMLGMSTEKMRVPAVLDTRKQA